MPRLEEALRRRYAAPDLDELSDVSGIEVAVTSYRFGMNAETMKGLPDLRAITMFGVGYDTVDVPEARRRGIAVANTPDVLTDCTADTAVALVLNVMRGFSAADRMVRRGAWATGTSFPLTRKVTGARVGILGLGRIGRAVARRLEAFDAQISYHSRTRQDTGYRYAASARELAESSDVLVVCTSGGPEAAGLVDADVLDALGPHSFLVNVARGSVVDEAALVAALEDGKIAGAGLDVYVNEPFVPESLLARDDVVLLPHVGSASVETRNAMADLVLENVASYLARGELVTPIENE